MSSWFAVTPEIAFAVAVLVLPGLLVARLLRFRWWDAVGLSVPLSLGALAIADEVSSQTGISWGLPVIVGTTIVVAAACWWFRWLAARRWAEATAAGDGPIAVDGEVWLRRQHAIAAAATLGAAVVGAIAVARGMRTPETLNQTFDGAFHVNCISAIAQSHLASPSFVAHLGDPSGTGGFYPPTFAAVGALLVMYAGLSPVAAANVLAVTIVVLWPVTMSIAVRRLARPRAFGYAIAMVGAVTVSLYPALLLEWGAVWPNTMSVLTIAPCLVLVYRLGGFDRSRDGAEDPHGRLDLRSCWVAVPVVLLGMLFAHPSALFMVFYFSILLLIWTVWRRFVGPDSTRLQRVRVATLATLSAGLLVVAVIAVTYQIPSVSVTGHYRWPPREAWGDALIQVLALTSRQTHANLAFALLVVVGLWVAVRFPRGRFLVACYGIVAVLCVFSAGVQSPVTMYLTGYWYNDPLRIFATIPVLALPLSALGADRVRARVVSFIQVRLPHERFFWSQRATTSVVAGVVVCLGIVTLQAGLGTARISRIVVTNYQYKLGLLVSPGQDQMFKRLTLKLPADQTIAGNPYTGEILAGVLSGRSAIYPTFSAPSDPVRALVALKFNQYRTDPVACAAIKSLNIGVVVTGRRYRNESPETHAPYTGFDDVGTMGLRQVDSGGGATVYRVGPCNSAPYVSGPLLTPGQEQMFKAIASQVPTGTTIAGSPYAGEIFAGIRDGQSVVYTRFGAPTGRDEVLVARKFRDLYTDPAVCAAVERLNIGVVVTGATYEGITRAERAPYAGFENLDTVVGLKVIASGGGATAYSLSPCGDGVTP